MGPERQRGRLHALPLLGAALIVAGVSLTRYHWSGMLVAALPVVVWLGLHARAFIARRRIDRPHGS